jgi:hypothetical protein
MARRKNPSLEPTDPSCKATTKNRVDAKQEAPSYESLQLFAETIGAMTFGPEDGLETTLRARAAIEDRRFLIIKSIVDKAPNDLGLPKGLDKAAIQKLVNAINADRATLNEMFPYGDEYATLSIPDIAVRAFEAGVRSASTGLHSILRDMSRMKGPRKRQEDTGSVEVKDKLGALIFENGLQTPEALLEFLHPTPKGGLPPWIRAKQPSRHACSISVSVRVRATTKKTSRKPLAQHVVFGLEGSNSRWSVGRTALLRFIKKNRS